MRTDTISPNLTSRLDARLVAYAAVAAAGIAAAPSAEAAIISSGPVNLTIPSDINGIYFNVVTGVSGTSSGTTVGWDINPFSATALNLFTGTGAGSNGAALGTGLGAYVGTTATTNYFNLAGGAVISSGSTFVNTGSATVSATTPLNLNSSNNLFGFRFFNEATSAINYGYFQVSLSTTAQGQPRSIVSYAYENTGAAITVVPEPGSVALLGAMAFGAVGVRAWKRRKAA